MNDKKNHNKKRRTGRTWRPNRKKPENQKKTNKTKQNTNGNQWINQWRNGAARNVSSVAAAAIINQTRPHSIRHLLFLFLFYFILFFGGVLLLFFYRSQSQPIRFAVAPPFFFPPFFSRHFFWFSSIQKTIKNNEKIKNRNQKKTTKHFLSPSPLDRWSIDRWFDKEMVFFLIESPLVGFRRHVCFDWVTLYRFYRVLLGFT